MDLDRQNVSGTKVDEPVGKEEETVEGGPTPEAIEAATKVSFWEKFQTHIYGFASVTGFPHY